MVTLLLAKMYQQNVNITLSLSNIILSWLLSFFESVLYALFSYRTVTFLKYFKLSFSLYSTVMLNCPVVKLHQGFQSDLRHFSF